MTLLICIWQAIHPDVPDPQSKPAEVIQEGVFFILGSFFVPEVMVAIAAKQWWDARDKVLRFRGMFSPTVDAYLTDKSRNRLIRKKV